MACTDASKASYALASKLLRKLDAEFGSEEGYKRAVLSDLAERKTLICKRCLRESETPSTDERVIICKGCNKEVWCTARTFYHKARLFRPRIALMRFKEEGVTITANQAAILLGVSNHTANLIDKQLSIAAASRTPEDAIEVPTSHCLAIISRRTTETPAREHPVAEELAVQKDLEKQTQRDDSNRDLKLSDIQEKVLTLISDSPINFDLLFERSKLSAGELSSTLVLLELQGLVEPKAGNRFVRTSSLALKMYSSSKNPQTLNREESLAKNLIYFVKDYFQGVGRKYLQPYATLHWIATDRKRWPKNSLRKLCASYPHIPYREVLAYVTAPTIRMVPRYNM